jgi:hypothetical protein
LDRIKLRCLLGQRLLQVLDALLERWVVEPFGAAAKPVALQTAISSRSRSISANAARRICCNVAGSSGRAVGAMNIRRRWMVVANRSQ